MEENVELPGERDSAAQQARRTGRRGGFAVIAGHWSRFIVLVPAFGMLMGAIVLTVVGAIEVGTLIVHAFEGSMTQKEMVIGFVEIADIFLLSVVLYMIALGLYELFIADIPGLPEWLVFNSLDDLKTQLIGVVVVVLAVYFLGRTLHGDSTQNLLYLGGGISLVIAALALFMRSKH